MTETLEWREVGSQKVWFDGTATGPESADSFRKATPVEDEAWSATASVSFDIDDRATAAMLEDLPLRLVEVYADRACLHAIAHEVEPGVWFASVTGLDGAWGDGASREEANRELRSAIVGWVAVRRRLNLSIPPIEGLDLNVPARARPA